MGPFMSIGSNVLEIQWTPLISMARATGSSGPIREPRQLGKYLYLDHLKSSIAVVRLSNGPIKALLQHLKTAPMAHSKPSAAFSGSVNWPIQEHRWLCEDHY